jgi:hypothetical protein
MKVQIKITPMGGYVMGDGECPFDPDEFLIAFGHKIIEAQMKGLSEVILDMDEFEAITNKMKLAHTAGVVGTPIQNIELPDMQSLINAIP